MRLAKLARAEAAARDVEVRHFEEACELLRHYSSLRFRQLTIFVAVNGGLLYALLRQANAPDERAFYGFAGLALLSAFAFAMLEFRLHHYLDHYRVIVRAYEEKFGLEHSLYDSSRRGYLVRGRIAILLFIASAVGLWVLVSMAATAT
jgi:hypothetical protein